jgi:tRNA(Ile)-lysidine synthase
MPNVPHKDAIERFERDLGALIGSRHRRIGLAISGGPDSLALLLLASAARSGSCFAATVDHRLRTESAGECAFVASICDSLSVSHSLLTLERPSAGNVSDWARRERYHALRRWAEKQKIGIILTAHHADDQLETVIMRLNRGSGVAGLSGIRSVNDRVARPLLGWRKSELERIVKDAGLTAVNDASNRDDRYDRARLRKMLATTEWLDPVAANRSARALADAEEALEWTTQSFETRIEEVEDRIFSLDPSGLPKELVRRLTLACLKRINEGANPRGDALDRLIAGLAQGKSSTLSGVKCSVKARWLFRSAPDRRKN